MSKLLIFAFVIFCLSACDRGRSVQSVDATNPQVTFPNQPEDDNVPLPPMAPTPTPITVPPTPTPAPSLSPTPIPSATPLPTATPTPTPTPSPTPAPLVCGTGGQIVGGVCWYRGNFDQSCTTVCSTHGLDNAATINFAGTGGTNANCQAVAAAFGQNFDGEYSPSTYPPRDCGCADYTNIFYGGDSGVHRFTGATTLNSARDQAVRRFCACNQ